MKKAISLFPPPNQSLLELRTCPDIEKFVYENHLNLTNDDLVRRHRLSLRSPPFGSLVSEILYSPHVYSSAVTPHFVKANSQK